MSHCVKWGIFLFFLRTKRAVDFWYSLCDIIYTEAQLSKKKEVMGK